MTSSSLCFVLLKVKVCLQTLCCSKIKGLQVKRRKKYQIGGLHFERLNRQSVAMVTANLCVVGSGTFTCSAKAETYAQYRREPFAACADKNQFVPQYAGARPFHAPKTFKNRTPRRAREILKQTLSNFTDFRLSIVSSVFFFSNFEFVFFSSEV